MKLIELDKENMRAVVELAADELASIQLTERGVVVKRHRHSSNCLSYHDVIDWSEKQLRFILR